MHVPEDLSVEVTIFCEAPAGASTGTSASVAVALVGALDRLTPGQLTPHEAAHEAHAIEVEMLGLQSGIQDQLAAAYGGINFIEMYQYPHASVSPIRVPDAVWWELERRLALIFLGKGHNSSQIHEKVIRELEDSGPDCQKLESLRQTAERSRDAIFAGDFCALGRAMTDNTGYQAELHPDLVSAGMAGDRDCSRIRRAGLESKRRRRRGRLHHSALRRPLRRKARDVARNRGGQPVVQEHPDLSQPFRSAHLGARRTDSVSGNRRYAGLSQDPW
jgi:hypothetical protein